MAFTATTPTGTSFADPAEWYDQYLADLTAVGGTLAQEEYTPYGGPRVAEWTPDQLTAFGKVRDSMDSWRPYANMATDAMDVAHGGLGQMASMAQGASTFDRPTFENTYLDIYMDPARQMQSAADSIGQRNFQNTTLKGLSDKFTGSGQFGSGRHQILGADAAAMAQAQIEEAKAGIGMDATKNAMADYLNWSKQGLLGAEQMGSYSQKMAQSGTDLMNFGLATQQASLADAALLGNVGQQQQTQNQQNLNLAYQDFQDQQNFPWQQLNKWSTLVHGGSIPNYNSQVTMPAVTPTTYQNPWMSALQGGTGGWSLGSAFSA